MDTERVAIAAASGSKGGVPSAACPLTCGPSEGVGAAEGSSGGCSATANHDTKQGVASPTVLPDPEVPPPPPPHVVPVPSKEDRLRAKATSTEHLCLHLDKNPYCDTCSRAKVTAMRACRKSEAHLEDKQLEFGDCITADTCEYHDTLDRGMFGEIDAMSS